MQTITYTFWSPISSNKNFRRGLSIKIFIKLIDISLSYHIFIIRIINESHIWNSHFLNCFYFSLWNLFFTQLLSQFLCLQFLYFLIRIIIFLSSYYNFLPLMLILYFTRDSLKLFRSFRLVFVRFFRKSLNSLFQFINSNPFFPFFRSLIRLLF